MTLRNKFSFLLSGIAVCLALIPMFAGAATRNPPAPTNLVAQIKSNDVFLSWRDNSNNESSFWVMRSRTGNGTDWQTIQKLSPGSHTTMTDTPNGYGTYYYRVRANTADGSTHSWSNMIKVTVPKHTYQLDLFYGNLITSFSSGARYSYRLLDARDFIGNNMQSGSFRQSKPSNPATDCDARYDLTGYIQSGGVAKVTNHSSHCSYPVGLAAYLKMDSNINNQVLVSSDLRSVGPNQTITLRVSNI